MRVLLILPFIISVGLPSYKKITPSKYFSIKSDSSIVHHTLDGSVKEWPSSMFNIHMISNISCAIDNDSQNLFIAMKIPDFLMQRKIMQEGLNLYIDLKAKKDKSNRIEFPIRSENSFTIDGLAGKQLTPNERSKLYKSGSPEREKLIKAMTALINSMKLSGFDKKETVEQELMFDNSVNIAFTWEKEMLYIEYRIPFHLLGISTVSKRNMTVGLNITAAEMPEGRISSDPYSSNNRPVGIGDQIGHQHDYTPEGSSTNIHPVNDLEIWTSEQTVWAKYICH